LLTTPDDRATFLLHLGADEVITLRTEPALLSRPAADFFHQVVRGKLDARALCEGPNFGFGKGREGDVALLGKLCAEAGIPLTIVPRFGEGAPVSSSRVREALMRGDVAEAAHLLGRPYLLRGVVGTGQRRGRAIGFPTANLTQTRTVVPGEGVYAARAFVGDAPWPAAVNIGGNPTFGEGERKIEAHLIGFDGDLYGKPLALEFLARLRHTRPFPGVDALVRQLTEDVAAARRIVEGAA
jgi:riboflavin kinase/FMN adenylyltransferase